MTAAISANNLLDQLAYQFKITTVGTPLPLTNNGQTLTIDLSAYALKTDVPNLQSSLTATLPLSIASNNLSIDLSSYATTTAVNTSITNFNNASIKSVYQLKLTTDNAPLSLTSNGQTLSIDLTAYQPALVTCVYGTSRQLIKNNTVQSVQVWG